VERTEEYPKNITLVLVGNEWCVFSSLADKKLKRKEVLSAKKYKGEKNPTFLLLTDNGENGSVR